MTRHVILVPWRGGDDRREWLYDMVRPWMAGFSWPIYEGDSEGPWARAAACNRASETAGQWDFALVADTDTICDPDAIRRAMAWVADTRGGVRPHGERRMLTQAGTLVYCQRGWDALEPSHFAKQWAGGGLLVIHREAWEAVGGYDETYVGWGYEDTAMALNLLTKASWDRLPGRAVHLYHPTKQNRPRRESLALYKRALADHAQAIAEWAADKGLREPQAVL